MYKLGSSIKPRLTSRRTPFSKQCVLVNSSDNTDNPRTWPMNTWNSRLANLSTRLHRYISSPSTNPIGHDLHRHCWVRLNRMRTGYGRFGQQMVRMGLATDPSCSCGCAVQTAHHAIYDCPITRCPEDFTTLDLRARDWLHTTHHTTQHVTRRPRHTINQSKNARSIQNCELKFSGWAMQNHCPNQTCPQRLLSPSLGHLLHQNHRKINSTHHR